jgi:hypothetical protein
MLTMDYSPWMFLRNLTLMHDDDAWFEELSLDGVCSGLLGVVANTEERWYCDLLENIRDRNLEDLHQRHLVIGLVAVSPHSVVVDDPAVDGFAGDPKE